MRRVCLVALLGVTLAGCAPGLRPGSRTLQHPDRRTVVHVLNRLTFGPRPGDVGRVQALGLSAYFDEQLHPELMSDDERVEPRLAPLTALNVGTRAFATDYYPPMVAARQEFTTRKTRQGARCCRCAATSCPSRR